MAPRNGVVVGYRTSTKKNQYDFVISYIEVVAR